MMSKWKKQCNEFVEARVKGKILDVGCGLSSYPNATTIDLLDKFNPDIVADINEKIPIPDNSFDTVIMNNVLEHLHNPQRAINECKRVLKPNGVLLVTVPFLIGIHEAPIDYQRYTVFMLERLFGKSEITPIGSVKDVYLTFQSHLFTSYSKWNMFAYTISRIIHYLTKLLPHVYNDRYIQGYFIKWRKP